MKVESGEIFLLDEDKTTLRMVLHRGEAAEAFWKRNLFKVGEGFIGLAAQTREAVVSNHLESDTRFMRETVVRAGFHQIACIPLMSGENLMGVLSVATRRHEPLEERSVQLLSAVGNWAGLAIENARLHANVRRFAVLAERERIGMDLHDGIIQSIYGVGLTLENAFHSIGEDSAAAKERVQQAIDSLNHVIHDLRSYILDLRPRQLGNDGLMNGLRRLVTEFRANTFAEVHLSGSEKEMVQLPHEHALALFHICQEALANAAKHAKAKNVQITLWTTEERVLMEIHDDGRGFDMEKISTSIGHGLANMRTRAHTVGGDVDITSVVGEGTTVLAWVPRSARG
jgi:signal transduction histidine kinase